MDHLYQLLRNIKNHLSIFIFCLFIFIFSLIFNTSFHYMGVDLTSEIGKYFTTEYIYKTLTINGKIFLCYVALLFFPGAGFLLAYKGQKSFLFHSLYLFAILLSLWGYSLIYHPQLYGEFFYIRHTYLLPLLYFLTDHISPYIFLAISYLFIFFPVIIIIIRLFKKRQNENILYLFFLVGYIIFIYKSSLFFLTILMFLYLVFPEKLARKQVWQMVGLECMMVIIFLLSQMNIHYILSTQKQSKKSQFPIFIIAADSLRYDRMGHKLNNRSITRNLDRFAREAIDYRDHHISIARTFPSWTSIFTGMQPFEHGILHMFPAPAERRQIGKGGIATLGHVLAQEGYQTAVFADFAGDIFPRIDFGFQTVQAPTFNAMTILVQKSIDIHFLLYPLLTGALFSGGEFFSEINSFPTYGDGRKILSRMKDYVSQNKKSPLFVTGFFSVAHFPYSPPYPYYNLFSRNYHGKYKYFKFVDPSVSQKPVRKDIEQLRNLFNSSIYAFDVYFGEFINFLKKEKLYKRSLIIVTGDHGESLYESYHGHGHGEHLRGENVTKVPLLIKYPQHFLLPEQRKYLWPTSAIDIYPTIMRLIGKKNDSSGSSLYHLLQEPVPDRMVYSETGIWFSDKGNHFFQSLRIPYPNILHLHQIVPEQDNQIMITEPGYRNIIQFAKFRAVISSRFKMIYTPGPTGVRYFFFDRGQDPDNQVDLNDQEYPAKKQHKDFLKSEWIRGGGRFLGDYLFQYAKMD